MEPDCLEPRESEWKWFPNLWWNRPPPTILRDVEESFFRACNTTSSGFYVDVTGNIFENKGEKCRIWTRKFNRVIPNVEQSSKDIPLLLIHGMAAGGAFFTLNVDGLSQFSTVYVIDLPGFARSTRCKFSEDPDTCEYQYIGTLENWRQAMGLDKFNLCGHSFGGYIASLYALKYPLRISNLILADPWGYGILPDITPFDRDYVSPRTGQPLSWWFRLIAQFLIQFNPLALYRFFGRMSIYAISRIRSDLVKPYNILWKNKTDNVLYQYIHHCNLHSASGESAFFTLSKFFAWAKRPLIKRIIDLDPNIPMTVIYGKNSWMKQISIDEFVHARGGKGNTSVKVIEEARHHVYAQHQEFNQIVIEACKEENHSMG